MRKNGSLTFWMILLGTIAAGLSTAEIVRRWSYLVTGARISDTLILASGVLLLASGAWRGLSGTPQPGPSWLGAAAAALFTTTMVVGMLMGAIPCSSVG